MSVPLTWVILRATDAMQLHLGRNQNPIEEVVDEGIDPETAQELDDITARRQFLFNGYANGTFEQTDFEAALKARAGCAGAE